MFYVMQSRIPVVSDVIFSMHVYLYIECKIAHYEIIKSIHIHVFSCNIRSLYA